MVILIGLVRSELHPVQRRHQVRFSCCERPCHVLAVIFALPCLGFACRAGFALRSDQLAHGVVVYAVCCAAVALCCLLVFLARALALWLVLFFSLFFHCIFFLLVFQDHLHGALPGPLARRVL